MRGFVICAPGRNRTRMCPIYAFNGLGNQGDTEAMLHGTDLGAVLNARCRSRAGTTII